MIVSPCFSNMKPDSQEVMGNDDTPKGSIDMGFSGNNPNKSQNDISYDGAVTFDRA